MSKALSRTLDNNLALGQQSGLGWQTWPTGFDDSQTKERAQVRHKQNRHFFSILPFQDETEFQTHGEMQMRVVSRLAKV